jgi:hypothetical protein
MNPARDLSQLHERRGQLVRRMVEEAVHLVRIPGEAVLGEPDRQRQRVQPLLRSVMEVALETPALGVTRLNQPCPRGGELLPRIGVRQRLRDQLGEAREALLGALGQRLLAHVGSRKRPPEAAVDVDGRGQTRAIAELGQPLR